MNIKKIIFLLFFSFVCFSVFAEGTENQKQFIKGNIQDKIAAVQKATKEEAVDLSKNAIQFSINYRNLLGQDRDLSALAVAGVLSLPNDYIQNASVDEKNNIVSDFYKLYTIFSDETLKIAVLNRIAVLTLPNAEFADLLNKYVQSESDVLSSPSLTKTVFSTLSVIGNGETFSFLYSCINDKKYASYSDDIKTTLVELMEKCQKDAVSIILKGNVSDCREIFDMATKNDKNSKIFRSDIAENVLSRTIFIMENTKSSDEKLIALQQDAYNFLASQKWTVASKTAVKYFSLSKELYEAKKITAQKFATVILSLSELAPLDCGVELSQYLQQINKAKESETDVPEDLVVLSIIKSLGSVGDKRAFDALLSVTYYTYSPEIVAAARDSLAGLKW